MQVGRPTGAIHVANSGCALTHRNPNTVPVPISLSTELRKRLTAAWECSSRTGQRFLLPYHKKTLGLPHFGVSG